MIDLTHCQEIINTFGGSIGEKEANSLRCKTIRTDGSVPPV